MTRQSRNNVVVVVIVACLLLVVVSIVVAHPQCLDAAPPFKPNTSHAMCSGYSDFGCCTDQDHDRLEERRDAARAALGDRWQTCGRYLEELLCQKCSPYAAHIFNAETSDTPNIIPGMCRGYCETFYDTCRDVVRFLDPNLPGQAAYNSRDAFCNHINIGDVDYCYPDLLTNDMLNRRISPAQITQAGCLCMEPIIDELRNPVIARHAGDGSGRLFVGEQLGLVHIFFPRNKTGLHTPFLDISDKVLTSPRKGDERGFFSIAFHPDFRNNGRFFLYYSTILADNDSTDVYGPNVPASHKIRISEMHVSASDVNRADPRTERVLLEVMEPYWNHNGGEMIFGDDGYLYLFVGDGGKAGDPHNLAQNKSVLLGKILRIDVDTPHPTLPYSIPPDNPFLGEPGARHEIYAYGVRNIWRCGKDRGDPVTGAGRGRMLCGDVGQDAWEELDLVVRGANYGWNAREGFQCFTNATCGRIGNEELPVYAYHHRVGKSVTGGVFYRGCESPNLNGQYLYADYMNGKMFRLQQDASGEWFNEDVVMCGTDVCLGGLTGNYKTAVLSFGEDEEGEIYMLTTGIEGTESRDGDLLKIVDPARRGNPVNCRHANRDGRVDLEQISQDSTPVTGWRSSSGTTDLVTGADNNQASRAPSITAINIRTCAVASSLLLCTLMSVQH